jgi:hypothetical protein
MQYENTTTDPVGKRVAELRRAVTAGEYAPGPNLVAAEVLATVGLIRRARKRIEDQQATSFEPEAQPPARRFAPRPELARAHAEEHRSRSAA